MAEGGRITDVVSYHAKRGELRGAVYVVRQRPAERFRWRTAVAGVNKATGVLRGRERLRVEEPVRELVLDLSDRALQREVVLDARKAGVDLDRGEVLPQHTLRALRELAGRHTLDLGHIARYTKLPDDPSALVDTAACVVVGRALVEHHRTKAHRLWLSVPDEDGPEPLRAHHRFMLERATRDRAEAERWAALTKALLGEG
jgi:hypothetical protein